MKKKIHRQKQKRHQRGSLSMLYMGVLWYLFSMLSFLQVISKPDFIHISEEQKTYI